MSKRKLAVDFGNASTLLGVWDEVANMMAIPPYTHLYAMTGPDSDTHVAPSLIHYHNKTDFLVGNQVLEHAARGGIVNPMSELKSRFIKYKKEKDVVDSQTAATNFLSTLLLAAKKRFSLDDDTEIVLTNPVNAYEDYKAWLQDLSQACGFRNIKLLDEPVAAALTLIDRVNDDDVFLVFDYGAYTLDVALVRFTKKKHDRVCERLGAKVLEDKAGDAVDSWLTKYVLENHSSSFRDLEPHKISSRLKKECKLAKQRLSVNPETMLELAHPAGPKIRIQLTRTDLQSVLESKTLLTSIKNKLKDLFYEANSIRMEDVKGVLLVGGSSYLLPVRSMLAELFGANKLFSQSPIRAVVHGATLYAGGAQVFDHIQHFYAFKYVDANMQRFKPVVSPYTDYPYDGKEPVIVHAVKPKQTEFKLYIYEFNSDPADIRITSDTEHPPNSICLNSQSPICIQVPHMVHKGDKAFEAHFSINADKHLVINVSAYDKNGRPTIQLVKDLVVVQLAKKQIVSVPRSVITLVDDTQASLPEPEIAKPAVEKIAEKEIAKPIIGKIAEKTKRKESVLPVPVIEKTKPEPVSQSKVIEKESANTPQAVVEPSVTLTQDEILKQKLFPYRNSFETSLTNLAILVDKNLRDDSDSITFLCDVLRRENVLNDGIYWKLKDVVSTLHAANHSKRVDRNMARWVDVIIGSLNNWLVTWSQQCEKTGKLSNKSWLVPESKVPERLLLAGRLLDKKIDLLSAACKNDKLSIDHQIIYLQNDDILCVKLADEIKEVRRYCRKASKGDPFKPREIQNSQWHLLVLPGINDWLDNITSRI